MVAHAQQQPNIVIVMTDQQQADLSALAGFPLDTTPYLDSLSQRGTRFTRAYTAMPACLPARVSMLTGRYPSAHRARTNHNKEDAYYEQDLIDVLHQQGYVIGLSGKNHSHAGAERFDFYHHLGHTGGQGAERSDAEKAFDQYLYDLQHRASMAPTPFPLECQCPYRAVSAAQDWLGRLPDAQPFCLWLSFPEPHNPYQVPEPYFSMFPPALLPPTRAGADALEKKGFKFQWTRHIGEVAFPDYAEQLPRARSNYLGMLRLIDDQVKRFISYLESAERLENTILIFLSDHGDFVGEYGLVRKGPELPECLTRIPLFFAGPGIEQQTLADFVSLVDILPTLCEAIGVDLPPGVQGRSLWPLLSGQPYPEEEFRSAYAEHGFGGLHYSAGDSFDPSEDGLTPGVAFDELNGWSQSGTMRMVRRGDWKFVFDMQGRGQLYNLVEDPVELDNLYGYEEFRSIQQELMAELLTWVLRVQDPLPYPRRRYKVKADPRNYWSIYKQ